jgi:hypothetical protein
MVAPLQTVAPTFFPVAALAGKVFVAASLIATAAAHAGIVVSNLDQPEDWFPFAAENVWRATSFTTGAEASTLDTITMRLGPGRDTGTAVPRLFADASGVPSGTALAIFDGQVVNSNREYTFTSAGLSLAANTTYWLALQGQGENLDWVATNSTAQSGIWTIGDVMLQSLDSGSTWPNSDNFVGQFSISATLVPEPSPLALALAGLACAAARRLWPAKKRCQDSP